MNTGRIQRPEAHVIAEEEFRRFAVLTASFTPDDWTRPTDCTAWTTRDVALHVLGAADAQASVKEFLRQFARGLPINRQIDSHHWVDGINEFQIRERRHLTDAQLVEQLTAVGPKAVAGRWGTPAPMRHLPIPFGAPVGWVGLWYLLDVGFTRDVWAHRIDLCVATDRTMDLTPDHDGRLSPISWGSGPTSTASRSSSSSPDRPAAASPRGPAANRSRSTRSTSSACSPAGSPAPASWPTRSRSDPWHQGSASALDICLTLFDTPTHGRNNEP